MNKVNMALLILAIFSAMMLTGNALATGIDANISTTEAIASPVSTTDAIEISETANVVNITEDSNETTVIESIIKEEQKKSSPEFGLTDTVIVLITAVILIMAIAFIRKIQNKKGG